MNPDEVVAIGAAIQEWLCAGRRSERSAAARRLTPLSLAIETLGGGGDADDSAATRRFRRRRPRRSRPRPTARRRLKFTCCRANARWQRRTALLGKFHLTGIPPAPRGWPPQIEVTFDIDANGILNVTAKDTATQKDQKITITSSSGLSKEEVERMAKEADAHSAEDKAARESIEAKNQQLDSMVYNVEKMLKEQGDKISGSDRGDVENALADAKKALESNDKATMDKARETLTQASHKLAEQMYKAAQPAPGSWPNGPPALREQGRIQASNGCGAKARRRDEGRNRRRVCRRRATRSKSKRTVILRGDGALRSEAPS